MDMTELCGTSNCSSSHSSLLTLSLTSMPGGVEETMATAPPSDPLNVMGRVGGVVISLTIVTGLVGNVLVLLAIVHCPQLRRSYNAFIASLSVTDLVCIQSSRLRHHERPVPCHHRHHTLPSAAAVPVD